MVAGIVAGWSPRSGAGWPSTGVPNPPGGCRSKEDFEWLDELWDTMWSGDVCVEAACPPLHKRGGLSEWSSDPSFAVHSRSAIGTRHPLNVMDDQKTVFADEPSCPSLYGGVANRGLLQRMKSWMDQMQDKRRGIVYTTTGPCQLFSDWGIPPYPEDYDWD